MLILSNILRNRFSTPIHPHSIANLPPYLYKRCLSSLIQQKEISGYQIKQDFACNELSIHCTELVHTRTGAKHVHIHREDNNNTFAVTFRTTPMDSTGVPHILEHTALCGSSRYPIRDPFFKMLNRSLSTFMNAMTSSDATTYPFSTQNTKDFYNLLGVYLDATFFPLLRQNDFKQEGWRLEHEDPLNTQSDIVYKGIVFNEMKGYLADPDYLFSMEQQTGLLPYHTYGVHSGGNPLRITDLTWQGLKDFHYIHYHPSNAVFYTYGNLPLERHLEFISERVLNKFQNFDSGTDIPLQPRWSAPKSKQIHTSINPLESPAKQTCTSTAYLLHSTEDVFTTRIMSIIGKLLVDGPNSPFFKTLIMPNIGSQYAPATGYDCSMKEALFSVGLMGIQDNDVGKVKDIIQNTLEETAISGFPPGRIEGIVHQMELSLKKDSANYGLSLASTFLPIYVLGGSLRDIFNIQKQIDLIKEYSEWTKLIEKWFLKNPHRLTLVMSPKSDHQETIVAAEKTKLKNDIKNLTQIEISAIGSSGLQLLEDQNKKQDVSCLPTLSLNDISRDHPHTELIHEYVGETPVQYCYQPTNGITYFSFLTDEDELFDGSHLYYPILCDVLGKVGARSMDYMQRAEQIERYTGGLGMAPFVQISPSNLYGYHSGFFFTSQSLDQNFEIMLSLWDDLFDSANLEHRELLKMIISGSAANIANSISYSGHHYAMSAAASTLNPVAFFKEEMSGLIQANFQKELVKDLDLDTVIPTLQTLTAKALHSTNMRLACNLSDSSFNKVSNAINRFISSIPGDRSDVYESEISEFVPQKRKIYYEFPFHVHHTSRVITTVPFIHPDSTKLTLLARILTNKVLHSEIREKGGAYGGGAIHSDGLFAFYSYRDPNCEKTLDAFNKAISWASTIGNITEQDLLEAKLAIFQSFDAPVTVSRKGMLYFKNRISHEMLQARREAYLDTTCDDIRDVCSKYLYEGVLDSIAVLGPVNTNKRGEDWQVVEAQV